ncbi:helix-turn-helix domain-containing protein [Salinirubellus salinus]|uniref:helix-turn-helix domain-containing protein n=1 Tax=Salinirubellus salinus TaxID=1364945 RepID=UPI003F639108
MSGVRAEIAVSGPSNCPVAALSAETATPVTDVTWSRADETFTEEFRVDSDVAAENTTALADADPVLEVGDERVYQFSREAGPDATCACEVVESLGHPLADVRVEGGDLVLTLHLPGVERLQEVVSDLEAVADDVEMRYLVHAAADGEGRGDRTVVDRGRLTERQREVLATAYELGYFEYPREANATEVAEALDVGLSTFAEHLAAAQGKLLSETLAV